MRNRRGASPAQAPQPVHMCLRTTASIDEGLFMVIVFLLSRWLAEAWGAGVLK